MLHIYAFTPRKVGFRADVMNPGVAILRSRLQVLS